MMRVVDVIDIDAPIETGLRRRGGRRTVAGHPAPLPIGHDQRAAARRHHHRRDVGEPPVRAFELAHLVDLRNVDRPAAVRSPIPSHPRHHDWHGCGLAAHHERKATHVDLIHDWNGPAWPLIRWPAAKWVILPIFVHGIASRTLAGIAQSLRAADMTGRRVVISGSGRSPRSGSASRDCGRVSGRSGRRSGSSPGLTLALQEPPRRPGRRFRSGRVPRCPSDRNEWTGAPSWPSPPPRWRSRTAAIGSRPRTGIGSAR